jgi:ATP-binding cassette, subfamily C (CFTR/MRP), member 10
MMSDDLEQPLLSQDQTASSAIPGAWTFDHLTFSFLSPLLRISASLPQLNTQDLPQLPLALSPHECGELLWQNWIDEVDQSKNFEQPRRPSLLRALFRCFGRSYLALGGLKFLNDVLNFGPPVFLNGLLRYLQGKQSHVNVLAPVFMSSLLHVQPSLPFATLDTSVRTPDLKPPSHTFGATCAALLAGSLFLKAFLNSHYSYQQGLIAARMKAAITSTTFRQTLATTPPTMSQVGVGRIQNLMSVDAERLLGFCSGIHELWSLPLQICIALWLLYTQVQFAFLSGLGVVILLIPLNKILATAIQRASIKMMHAKDERLHALSEILRGVKSIKASGWENAFASHINASRQKELRALATKKYLDAWCVFFWAASTVVFSTTTFGLYAYLGKQLTAQTVFTSLALFNVLLGPINAFPWVINGVVEAAVSLRRLESFLGGSNLTQVRDSALRAEDVADAPAIQLKQLTVSYSDAHSSPPCLKDVNLAVPVGAFMVITGAIGSGKSALLAALLGEANIQSGEVVVRATSPSTWTWSYAGQDPWAMSGTIRENILMESSYDPERYRAVLHACALEADIESMPAGDSTLVEERGTTLSGGQRARLALARAIFRSADAYLLDDVIASVDVHVASWIVRYALKGPLLAGKTVVAVGHAPVLLAAADVVVSIEGGRITNIIQQKGHIPQSTKLADIETMPGTSTHANDSSDVSNRGTISLLLDQGGSDEEERQLGHVKWKVYRRYLSLQGLWVPIIIITLVLMQATRNGSDAWLSVWVAQAHNDTKVVADASTKLDDSAILLEVRGIRSMKSSTRYYLAGLFVFAGLNAIFTLCRAFAFAQGGLVAARLLHERLLSAILAVAPNFFTGVPSGRIINRFSSDTAAADDALPFIANIFLAQVFGLVGMAAVLVFTQPYLVFACLPIVLIYSRLQIYFRATSRELRRIQAVSSSPIYSLFSTVIDGGPTIRAFQAQSMFLSAVHDALATQQRASVASLAAVNWLGLRLQSIAGSLAACIAALAVTQHAGIIPGASHAASAGFVGLSLAYISPITGFLNGLVTSGAETEQEMVCVERIEVFSDLRPQPDTLIDPCETIKSRLHALWPQQGAISFDNVWLRYRSFSSCPIDSPAAQTSHTCALQGFTLAIPAGAHVAFVGRTGAGKSSAVACLLRMAEISSGTASIDGVDVRAVPLKKLRAALGYIPQEAFVFANATVRMNVDPLGQCKDDAKIERALRKTGLWTMLEKHLLRIQPDCATHDDSNCVRSAVLSLQLGQNFNVSHGQTELLCLARIMLQCPRVLLLDEPSAAADEVTALRVRQIVHEEFANTTVSVVDPK